MGEPKDGPTLQKACPSHGAGVEEAKERLLVAFDGDYATKQFMKRDPVYEVLRRVSPSECRRLRSDVFSLAVRAGVEQNELLFVEAWNVTAAAAALQEPWKRAIELGFTTEVAEMKWTFFTLYRFSMTCKGAARYQHTEWWDKVMYRQAQVSVLRPPSYASMSAEFLNKLRKKIGQEMIDSLLQGTLELPDVARRDMQLMGNEIYTRHLARKLDELKREWYDVAAGDRDDLDESSFDEGRRRFRPQCGSSLDREYCTHCRCFVDECRNRLLTLDPSASRGLVGVASAWMKAPTGEKGARYLYVYNPPTSDKAHPFWCSPESTEKTGAREDALMGFLPFLFSVKDYGDLGRDGGRAVVFDDEPLRKLLSRPSSLLYPDGRGDDCGGAEPGGDGSHPGRNARGPPAVPSFEGDVDPVGVWPFAGLAYPAVHQELANFFFVAQWSVLTSDWKELAATQSSSNAFYDVMVTELMQKCPNAWKHAFGHCTEMGFARAVPLSGEARPIDTSMWTTFGIVGALSGRVCQPATATRNSSGSRTPFESLSRVRLYFGKRQSSLLLHASRCSPQQATANLHVNWGRDLEGYRWGDYVTYLRRGKGRLRVPFGKKVGWRFLSFMDEDLERELWGK
jgi:hypothetical protein